MCKQRNTYIDIAKGIGIIMVLGLHTGFHFEWMTPFEMPLFFFLSGVLFNEKIPFKLFVVKKRYEDSFVIFSLLVLLMIPVCLLIKCYFPYLIGRKSIIKLSSSSKD